jgi:hypothetical protein
MDTEETIYALVYNFVWKSLLTKEENISWRHIYYSQIIRKHLIIYRDHFTQYIEIKSASYTVPRYK